MTPTKNAAVRRVSQRNIKVIQVSFHTYVLKKQCVSSYNRGLQNQYPSPNTAEYTAFTFSECPNEWLFLPYPDLYRSLPYSPWLLIVSTGL